MDFPHCPYGDDFRVSNDYGEQVFVRKCLILHQMNQFSMVEAPMCSRCPWRTGAQPVVP